MGLGIVASQADAFVEFADGIIIFRHVHQSDSNAPMKVRLAGRPFSNFRREIAESLDRLRRIIRGAPTLLKLRKRSNRQNEFREAVRIVWHLPVDLLVHVDSSFVGGFS